jgi:uncharacterized membrane protein YdfJ with MMPL/SSD domain
MCYAILKLKYMSFTVSFIIISIVVWIFAAIVLVLTAPKPHKK